MTNLLTDSIFRVETPQGNGRLSLPSLLASMGENSVLSLLGLQRHQEDAFHVFLCYLAGAALSRAGRIDPRQSADFWRESLLRLSDCDTDAWQLVVEDPTQPAFMQPAIIGNSNFASLKSKARTPDALDLLPTAKNHDLKSSRSLSDNEESWVYALISLQTMCGFFGQGNYGISRMNGGFASRPVAGLNYINRDENRWFQDCLHILKLRKELLSGPWGYREGGVVLTWCVPWNLKDSLSLSLLDPFFIEVSRVVRLMRTEKGIAASSAPTKGSRVAAKDVNGVLGDPWIPINVSDKKKGQSALTVGSAGLTPGLLRNLLFEDGYNPAALQLPYSERVNEPCYFTISVLVRGQGTTDGFHQVTLPIPAEANSRLFSRGPERDLLSDRSKTALNDAGQMLNRVLKPSVFAFLQAGPERIDFDKREVASWWESSKKRFTDSWSPCLFTWLWSTMTQSDDEQVYLDWRFKLKDKALGTLKEAITRYPIHNARRYRARVKAENVFNGALIKIFPGLKGI